MKYLELNSEVMRKVDNFFQLDKDILAMNVYLEEVKEKLIQFDSVKERFDYMIENNYYVNILDSYDIHFIAFLYELAFEIDFKFQSYMAASKFYRDYALKTNDGRNILETYEDRVIITSLYLANGDNKKATKYVEVMMKQNYQPATPTFLNAGKSRRGEMVSCFLLEMDDSLNSIGFNINTSMQLSKIGGGVALNLSKLRGRGETIKEIDNAASGVVPVMKLLEDSFSYANQLGQRKGAGAAYLNIFHWDIIEFLDTKKINADEKSRIQSLSIGLIVPQKFFDLVKGNEPLYVFAPYTVYKSYGQHLDDLDIDMMYEELIENPLVKKKELTISARELLIKIAMIQLESGYPYIVYKTNANQHHTLKDIGQIKMSNLCTEIFQLQESSEIHDYGDEDVIRRDINCNLGSLNIVNVMENYDIQGAVYTGMDMLTDVSDLTNISNAPSVKKANDELHSVGLGAMNLHGYLAKNKIPFESEEAKDFARTFFMMMNYYSIEKSMFIARGRKETFLGFEQSEYAKGTYFKKYEETDYAPQTKKVKFLFKGIYIPTSRDWMNLRKLVQRHGLFHAYRLAIAPTQSISYIQNSTPSIMPVVNQIETRTYANATTYYPMPFLSKETFLYYKSAYDTDQMKILDLVATIQEHVDQGISTILYVDSEISTRELARYYIYANELGLKSLYYTRTRNQTIDECLTCSV